MGVLWGGVMIVLGLLCWGGQSISWLAPGAAERWSLTEGEDTVEPVYFSDIRSEALWDALTLWTMPVAGVFLVVDNPAWAYFGLIGSGMYAYFAGRGIVVRFGMQRRGFRIGAPGNVRIGYAFLALWGGMALITAVAAVVALPTS
jgi:hypothetical protein